VPVKANDFFEGKRPWSRIKDRILGQYMSPYVAKVVKKGERLLLIDAFAGPGKFEKDDEAGSPLIICNAAKKHADGKYRAFFFNNEREHHEKLEAILRAGGWWPNAQAILGDAQDLLHAVTGIMKSQSVFLYLDPFGLKDCKFSTLEPFLTRPKRYSTEIIVNLNATGLHRHAAREAYKENPNDPQLMYGHQLLTDTLGGDYWKAALLADNNLSARERERIVVDQYKAKLESTNYLVYTGDCPVMESRDGRTKYYMIFASPHRDAKVLLSDHMCRAFNMTMTEEEMKDTLFAGVSWKDWRNVDELVDIVIEYVKANPGFTREDLWAEVVDGYFMHFTESEYKKAVDSAVKKGAIDTPTLRKTKRLNDQCQLFPK